MSGLYSAETEDSGDVVSYIPLTTSYAPPGSCSGVFRLDGPSLVAYDPGYGLDVDSDVVCGPQAVTTWWEQARLGLGLSDHTALSIGPLTCPGPFTTAATSVDGSSTSIFCCPSGYDLENAVPGSAGGDCLSNVMSGQVLTYASTPLDASTDWTIVTTTLTASSTVGAIAVAGWNIKQATTSSASSRLSSSRSSFSSATTSSSSNPPSSGSTTSSQTSTTAASSSPSNGGLSPGATAGIGVGAALAVIGLIAIGVAFWFVKRNKRTPEMRQHGGQETGNTVGEYKGGYQTTQYPQELDVRSPTELPTSQPHYYSRQELE